MRIHFYLFLFFFLIESLFPFGITYASERDIHFTAVYALLRLSNVKKDDAFLISRASESLDENAETSPMPEPSRWGKNYPTWHQQGSKWHSLPPYLKEDPRLLFLREIAGKYLDPKISEKIFGSNLSDDQYVFGNLVSLYDRAKNTENPYKAKLYFGEYLHAVVDAVAHVDDDQQRYHDLWGHIRDWHKPDLPSGANYKKTEKIVRVVIGEISQFQRDRFHDEPSKVSQKNIQDVVNALTAVGSSGVPVSMREEEARLLMEKLTKVSIPQWDSENSPLVLNADGEEEVDRKRNKPEDWESKITHSTSVSIQSAISPKGEGPGGPAGVTMPGKNELKPDSYNFENKDELNSLRKKLLPHRSGDGKNEPSDSQ